MRWAYHYAAGGQPTGPLRGTSSRRRRSVYFEPCFLRYQYGLRSKNNGRLYGINDRIGSALLSYGLYRVHGYEMKFTDLSGRTFGRLTALSYAGKSRWLCACSCGGETLVRADHLKSGNVVSCGCYSREVASKTARELGLKNKTHGGNDTPLYSVWHNMIQRCECSTDHAYPRYGARGICVCELWRRSFETFRSWAAETGYRKGLSIDRINNDEGYSPENCRWATKKEQGRNRSTCVYVQGKCVSEWADDAVVALSTVRSRLKKGWTIEDAVSVPARGKHAKVRT